jgi:hypothetical protein
MLNPVNILSMPYNVTNLINIPSMCLRYPVICYFISNLFCYLCCRPCEYILSTMDYVGPPNTSPWSIFNIDYHTGGSFYSNTACSMFCIPTATSLFKSSSILQITCYAILFRYVSVHAFYRKRTQCSVFVDRDVIKVFNWINKALNVVCLPTVRCLF